jgi:inner membrane protein
MTGKTHDLAAFTALTLVIISLPSLPPMNLATLIAAFGANFIGGLFPDIDQPTSDFWDNFRLGPYVAKIICPALGGHRHISHSLVGLALIAFVSDFILRVLSKIILIDMTIVWWSFMIGVVSHLIMDLPTKAGLPLLWPLKWKFGFPPMRWMRIESGAFIENWVVFPGLLFFTIYLLHHYQDTFLPLFHIVF